MSRPIRFLGTQWGQVAYTAIGSGPPVLVDTGWVSHLEALWAHDGYRGLMERLSETHRVICYDAPGTGMSERHVTPTSIDDEVDVLGAVLDAAGVTPKMPASLFSSSIAASTSIRMAAKRPDLIRALVLFGATPRGEDLAPPDARDALLSLIRTHWGLGARAIRDIFLPDVGADDREWFESFQRQSADAEIAARRLEMYYSSDVTADAGQVRAPTLVLHRVDDRAVQFSHGAELAAAINGARLEPVDGSAHLCFLGDWSQIADLVIPFLEPTPINTLPRGPYGEFTARETDVAELTTLGLTNAGIGERLGISDRTVETHLRNVRYKLGVKTRAEVAAWMARRAELR